MRKKRFNESRPNYYHGQLLLESDFLAEQDYHIHARRRHNLNLHGWGVVRGLDVVPHGVTSVVVNPGFAIDSEGRDLLLDEVEHIDLQEYGPNETVLIGLSYEEEALESGSVQKNVRECFVVLTSSRTADSNTAVILACIRLDDQGKLQPLSIDYARTRYATSALRPGTVTAEALSRELRRGWLRLPFRPIELENEPEGKDERIPPFRVGATEARSPRPHSSNEKDVGAGGTMAIALPPGMTCISGFRLAGAVNEGEILFKLMIGGWEDKKAEHLRKVLVEGRIKKAPFSELYAIADVHVDPMYHTLSLWLRSTRAASISLVAVELSY